MIELNKYLDLNISDLGVNGEGIGHIKDYTFFVDYALPGEKVQVKIVHVKKNLVYAKLIKIYVKSPHRIMPVCSKFRECGGCDFLHLDYVKQLEYKHKSLKNTLMKVGGIDIEAEEIMPSIPSLGYRNNIQIPFGYVDNKIVLGFYRKKTHEIVPIKKCHLQGEWAEKLMEITLDFATSNEISVYDGGNGILRHLVARYLDDNLFVTLVINEERIENLDEYYNSLIKVFKNAALSININKKSTNVILGKKLIEQKSNVKWTNYKGIKLKPNPLSFFQVNSYIQDLIYEKVLAHLMQEYFECVIDAYGGVGLLGAYLAKNSKAKIYNIDIVQSAIDDANEIVLLNKIENMANICSDAQDVLGDLIKNNANLKTLLIVDPPRKGLSEEACNIINQNMVASLIYISCNSATLARDLKRLSNYKITSITPFDMFANTTHLEIFVLLEPLSPLNLNICLQNH